MARLGRSGSVLTGAISNGNRTERSPIRKPRLSILRTHKLLVIETKAVIG